MSVSQPTHTSGFAQREYLPEDGEPRLVRSGVLFLDVLGVERGACGVAPLEFLRRLRTALEEARARCEVDDEVLHMRALFSDSLIAGFPLVAGLTAADVIGPAIVMAAEFQLELIKRGFFLRGGIAFGDHYMDSSFAFGPALVEAAVLETRADVPRVVLSAGAADAELDAIRRSLAESSQRQYLLDDADGVTFVSYLDVAMHTDNTGEIEEVLKAHREMVCEKLEAHAGQPTIESKYLWVARYHNYVCEERAPQPVGTKYVIGFDSQISGLEDFAPDSRDSTLGLNGDLNADGSTY
jgi:hypothetical protein